MTLDLEAYCVHLKRMCTLVTLSWLLWCGSTAGTWGARWSLNYRRATCHLWITVE